MSEQEQGATPEQVADESEVVVETTQSGATDTPETVAETDEQKNEREVREQQERSAKKARGVQKRLDELTADKYAEREARQRAEQQVEWMREQMTAATKPQAQASGEPQRTQFDDYEKYVEARAEWRAAQIVDERWAAKERAAQEQANQQSAQAQAVELARTLQEKQATYAKTHTDYYEVVNNEDIVVPPAAALAIMKHKDSPAIMFHIGKNPALAESLAKLDPFSQALAIGEIAATLKQSPQVSSAPAPGKPVGSRGATTKSLEDMSYDEFVTARRKQIAARR